MIYRQFHPHACLSKYIDAYWTAKGSEPGLHIEKILPDGCIDIILNLGDDCITEDGLKLENEKTYLVGTMTRFKQTVMSAETQLLGVRFKAGCFAYFYPSDSLHTMVDQTVLFEKKLAPDVKNINSYNSDVLDRFFLSRLIKPNVAIDAFVDTVNKYKGQISVTDVAKINYTTTRQLERMFRQYIGISPKEFLNLSRYQFAIQQIRYNPLGRSLMQIAFECGYYDHAHLTNEIKKYTGSTPSEL